MDIASTPLIGSAAPLEQMIEMLDAAAPSGFETYLPIWQRLVTSVGADVTIMWDGIWPALFSGMPMDSTSPEILRANVRCRDALFDHMRRHGFRPDLIRNLIGDRDGTNPDADDYQVGRAVAVVVADYLAAGGRIQIEPDGTLSSGSGIHDDYGLGDAARDTEIERSARAYVMASLCPRAVPAIKLIAGMFGSSHANGWTDLRKREWSILLAFTAWQSSLTGIMQSEADRECTANWAVFEFAERLIKSSAETGRRAAEIHLWTALRYEAAADRDGEVAIANEDIAFFEASNGDLGNCGRDMVRAILALRANEAHA